MTAGEKANLPAPQQLSDDALRGIQSFEDALALLGGTVDYAQDHIGSGFELCEDKNQLVKMPLLFLQWQFYPGSHGEFVAAHVVTKSKQRLIINDGGSGIYAQLKEYSTRTGKFSGLLCEKGLTRSDYTYIDDQGESKPATTFYLA